MRNVSIVGATALLACVASCCLAQMPSEAEMLADAADGRLDFTSFFQAALVAGGESRETITRAEETLRTRWLEVEPLLASSNPDQRAKVAFLAMHRLLLTGRYVAECTEVGRTLDTGDYNCVTATALYLELCRRHGIEGQSVAIPGHVYCRLPKLFSDDVQTTCREWFEVRDGRAASPAAKAILDRIRSGEVKPRALSDVQLLGKIYYNRGVSALEKQDFAQAISLLHRSLKLDPQDEPARNNLLAAHNNWALALCDRGEFEAASKKLSEGRAIDAEYGPLKTNDLYVHQKWVLHLCDRGRYSDAVDLLDAGHKRRPESPLFDTGRYTVYGLWSKALLEANRVREACEVLDDARRRYGDSAELLEHEVQTLVDAIKSQLGKGNHTAAATLHQIAIARHPRESSLVQLRVSK